jgi:hypothetical protein
MGIGNFSMVIVIREQNMKSPLDKEKIVPRTQSNVRFKYLNIWLTPLDIKLGSMRHPAKSLDNPSSMSAIEL